MSPNEWREYINRKAHGKMKTAFPNSYLEIFKSRKPTIANLTDLILECYYLDKWLRGSTKRVPCINRYVFEHYGREHAQIELASALAYIRDAIDMKLNKMPMSSAPAHSLNNAPNTKEGISEAVSECNEQLMSLVEDFEQSSDNLSTYQQMIELGKNLSLLGQQGIELA